MKKKDLLEEFSIVGRDLLEMGLVTSHGGNLSVRRENNMVITKKGCMLGHITPEDLVEVGIEWSIPEGNEASTETVVHRSIYQKTSASAIVHAHPLSAILLSFTKDEVLPVDKEGSFLLHEVPVIVAAGGYDSAEALSAALKGHRAVILRGHGSFAVGESLKEALCYTSALEASSRLLILARMLGEDPSDWI